MGDDEMTSIKQHARLMEAAYKGDNEMTEPLDDYTKAQFPLDLQWQDFIMVRLFGVIGERVIGASYTVNSDGTEAVSQVLDWAGTGEWSSGEYPNMNLPMTPARMNDHRSFLRSERAAITERLEAYPGAPEEWRSKDEKRLADIDRELAELKP